MWPGASQGRQPDKKAEEKKVRGLGAFLRLWREQETPSMDEKPNAATSMNVEFLYSLEELNRRDEERKEPRDDPNAMSDPYSLSNILGAIGEFLERKPYAKLLFACSHRQEVVILYETKDGARNLEQYPISTIYEFWIRGMYIAKSEAGYGLRLRKDWTDKLL